jgi:hypothetical protein
LLKGRNQLKKEGKGKRKSSGNIGDEAVEES